MGLLILVFFTALMAGLFCWIEGWDFGTSLYFQYITYLTIGFGDVVPAKEQVKIHAVNNPDLPRVRNKFFGIRDLPYLKAGIRNFNARWRRNSGLKIWMGCVMPKIAIGSTGLSENLGRDDAIKKAEYSRLSSVPAARHVSIHRKETCLATRIEKRRLCSQFMFFCNTFFLKYLFIFSCFPARLREYFSCFPWPFHSIHNTEHDRFEHSSPNAEGLVY